MQQAIKKKQSDHLSIFEGLSENELNSLYNVASIKNVQHGDFLIKEGDTDQTVFVILDGKIKILKEVGKQQKGIATLSEGDWIGEISFTKKVPRTASAMAMENSRVMAINIATLDVLEEKTRLYILKKLNDLASERINQLIISERETADKNRQITDRNSQLIEYISSINERNKVSLSQSKMIQRIVKGLSALPVYPGELAAKLINGLISPDEISKMIQSDPSLLALTLKKVNSPDFGFDKQFTDIKNAVVLAGTSKIYKLITDMNIKHTMPETQFFMDIYCHSVGISNIAFELSQVSKIGIPPQLATIGLLYEIGNSIVGLINEGKLIKGALIGSIDQARLGSLLLKSWGLPDIIWQAIELQSHPEFSPPDKLPVGLRETLALLYISDLCYRVLRGWIEKDLPTMFLDEHKRLFGWEGMTLEDIVKKCTLPGLVKKIETFPDPFKKVINRFVQAIG